MNIEETENLIARWQELKDVEQNAQKERKFIEQQIVTKNHVNISNQLDPNYGTGSASITTLNNKVTLNYPKKVTWDNEKLSDIWDAIIASGQDPQEYIDRKLSVSETRYKNMPSIYRGEFEDARTVEAGNPTFSIKEIK